ncbi:MAG: DUF2093 domain-containing protein [Pseudomonadota bacterium]
MLNRVNIAVPQAATLRFSEADYTVVSPGTHVVCAITGKAIPLDELKYWSFARQEAYVDAEASVEAERRAGNLD